MGNNGILTSPSLSKSRVSPDTRLSPRSTANQLSSSAHFTPQVSLTLLSHFYLHCWYLTRISDPEHHKDSHLTCSHKWTQCSIPAALKVRGLQPSGRSPRGLTPQVLQSHRPPSGPPTPARPSNRLAGGLLHSDARHLASAPCLCLGHSLFPSCRQSCPSCYSHTNL